MYILASKPSKDGTLSDAFDAIDNSFGTDEFSDEQAASAIALAMSVDDRKAEQLFKNLIDRSFVSEV